MRFRLQRPPVGVNLAGACVIDQELPTPVSSRPVPVNSDRSRWPRSLLLRWLRHAALTLLILALVSACGPLGDDDDGDDPTATAAVPAGAAPTAQVGAGTPAATPVATPRAQVGAGTPRAGVAPTQTPESDDEDSGDDSGTPGVADEPDEGATDESPQADDEAEPTDEEEPDPTTVVVSDCEEPEELPERTGRQNRVVAADDGLILRSGPGTSCDEITSLALNTPVRVISGVVEAEDDDVEWVKVDVDGEEGWVSVEFLENPSDD